MAPKAISPSTRRRPWLPKRSFDRDCRILVAARAGGALSLAAARLERDWREVRFTYAVNEQQLRSALSGAPDLILLDPRLSPAGAVRLLETIAGDAPRPAVIVVGRLAPRAVIIELLRLGARDFVERVDARSLAAAIERVLRPAPAGRRKARPESSPEAAPYDLLFSQHPDAMLMLDSAGRITAVNAALSRLLRSDAGQLRGSEFAQFLAATERDRFTGHLARALRGDAAQDLVTQGERADGTVFEVSLTTIPVVRSASITGVFLQVREITGFLSAERALAQAEHEQRRMARLNGAILDSLPAHIALLDGQGRIITVNEAWRRFGRENGLPDPGGAVGANYIEICRAATGISAEGAELVAEGLASILQGGRAAFTLQYPCHSSAERRWFRLHANAVDDAPQRGAVVMHMDVTEGRLATEQARLAANALRQMAEGVLVTDDQMRVVTTNQAFCRMMACTASESVGSDFAEFLAGTHLSLMIDGIRQSLSQHGSWKGELVCRRADGTVLPAHMSIAAVHGDGEVHYVAVVNDLSTQQDYERRLDHVSQHDSLTGLPNRAALAGYARLVLANAQGQPELAALVLIALDRFKLVNDSLGHAMGDALLQAVAARLRAAVPAEEMLARLSGDEFALMLTRLADPGQGEQRAREIHSSLNAPFVLGGRPLFVTASAGVSCAPLDGLDFETLLRNADVAMQQIKASGGNGLSRYVGGMGRRHLEHLMLQNDLQLALERDEFLLHFQPTLDLRTNHVVSAEALVRWQHPTLGLLGPSRFIHLAEESGAIVRLGEWVLRTACAEAVRWRRERLRLSVAVNLSARQFELPDLSARIGAILFETGLEPEGLRLEVTEGIVMSNREAARQTLSELAAMGVRLALDDFGTGYSSLGYLQQFPLHCLKIDRTFVKDIPASDSGQAIAHAVVTLGNALHMRVVAEGIETQAQLEFLRQAGCHEVQGYLFCMPIAGAEFLRWALAHNA